MTPKQADIYNIIYDWFFPISFIIFIGILIAIGITHNENIFLIGGISLILIDMFVMFYLFFSWYRFKLWIKSKRKYQLNDDEKKLWGSIMNKADAGYKEWLEQTQGDDLCGPWLKDYTKYEEALIEKIHKYFYGDNWYCVMPLTCSQVNYLMYYEIKDKVK